ncbi:MAG TPA: nucleotidyltransferase family protein [Patescibacteria group bacterium]
MSEEIQKIQQQIVPILKEAGVLKSALFGSVARGEADQKSDVDILVELPDDKSLFDLIDLQEKLESVLGKKVDIGTYRSIKPILRDRILHEQVQIYEK